MDENNEKKEEVTAGPGLSAGLGIIPEDLTEEELQDLDETYGPWGRILLALAIQSRNFGNR
jgi:hypothetical protein